MVTDLQSIFCVAPLLLLHVESARDKFLAAVSDALPPPYQE